MVKKFEAWVDQLYEKLDRIYHRWHIIFDILFYVCLVLFFCIALMCDAEKTIRTKVLLKPYMKQLTWILDWYLLPGLAGLTLLFEFKDKKMRLTTFFALYILMLYQLTADKHIVAIIPHCNLFYFGGACLITAAKGRDFKKIGWTYVITASAYMILVTGLAVTGVITDIVVDDSWRLGRHALGMNYPINYVAHWFSILIVYYCVKDGLLKLWDYALGILLIWVGIFLCKAQTSTLLMSVLLLGTLYRQVCIQNGRKRLFRDGKKNPLFLYLAEYSYVIMAAFMIIASLLYMPPVTTLFYKIAPLRTFGDRLGMGRYGLLHYFPSLLGIDYPTSSDPATYFFIDCSYIVVLLKCGIVIFAIVMASLCYMTHRIAKAQQIYWLCLVALFSAAFAMEHHLMEIAFHPFWFMMFTTLRKQERQSDS